MIHHNNVPSTVPEAEGDPGVLEPVAESFVRRFGPGSQVLFVRAPYRICPLGAHIDHQGGVVLGMAVERGVTLAWRRRPDRKVFVESRDYPGQARFQVDEPPPAGRQGHWTEYVAGAAWVLGHRGYRLTCGLEGIVSGELPVGGLSSSAAVGLCYGVAFRAANGLPLRTWDVIESTLQAENEYVGLSCGLLDPATVAFSRRNQLLRIDCREREVSALGPGPDPESYRIAVVFSGVTRALIRSGYNKRVEECRSAARALSRKAGLKPLRERLCEIAPEIYVHYARTLEEPLRRRAEHFFSESARVARGEKAWQRGDIRAFGALMNESGRSSVTNYEAGCPEVISLWEIIAEAPGVYGTRFSGGGFGGAVIALVDPSKEDLFTEEVRKRYLDRHPECREGFDIYFLRSSDGLSRLGAT